MLRRCVLLALAAATLAIPAAARADVAPACRITPVSDMSVGARLDRLVTTGLGQAVEPALGDQYAGAWLKLTEDAWYAGVAPGGLDLAAAQAKLDELIASRLPGDDAAFVTARLRVVAEPYSWPELRTLQTQLWADLGVDTSGIGATAGIGCATSDAWRVEVTYFNDSSPDAYAAAQAVVARYGDRARIQRVNSPPPTVTVAPAPRSVRVAPPRLRDLITVPKTSSCVRGDHVRLRVRDTSVRGLSVNGHRARLRRGAVSVPLLGHQRTLQVMATLADGRTASATLRYIRC